MTGVFEQTSRNRFKKGFGAPNLAEHCHTSGHHDHRIGTSTRTHIRNFHPGRRLHVENSVWLLCDDETRDSGTARQAGVFGSVASTYVGGHQPSRNWLKPQQEHQIQGRPLIGEEIGWPV